MRGRLISTFFCNVVSRHAILINGGKQTILRWLPDAAALEMTTRAAREWLGYWIYGLPGILEACRSAKPKAPLDLMRFHGLEDHTQ